MTNLERIVVKRGQRWVAIYVPVEDELHPGAVPGAIKAEARRRIVQRLPEWKQANMIARMTELLKIGAGSWTPENQAEVAALEYLWDWVKAVRAKSDELEATAAGMTVAEASALNLFDDDTWAL
jgi:hypothetical protein